MQFSQDGNRALTFLEALIDSARDGWTTEVLTHAGYGEEWREDEVSVLLDPRTRAMVQAPDVELVTFSDL
jgi:hypothetical protein